MTSKARTWLALSATSYLAISCSTTPTAIAPAASTAAPPSATDPSTQQPAQQAPGAVNTTVSHGQNRHGSGGGGAAPAPALPADFPTEVPVPPGTLQGSTGAAGRWGLLLLAHGPADQVLATSMAFYRAAGFTTDGPATVHRGQYQVVLVAENRDHSNTETNLAAGITKH